MTNQNTLILQTRRLTHKVLLLLINILQLMNYNHYDNSYITFTHDKW